MPKPTHGTDVSAKVGGPGDFASVFDVSQTTIDRLAIYDRLLRQWQRAGNLVASSTLDETWHRHFADSAQLLALAPSARTWIDLGSGAGFPGLVISILLADPAPRPGSSPPSREGVLGRVTLIESNGRKCAFLREVVRQTGIAERVLVEILSTRIEAAATQANLRGADVVAARALAPLDKLLSLSVSLFERRTVGMFLKGRNVPAELEAAKSMWDFNVELVPSRTECGASVVLVRNLAAKAEPKGQTP
jgi:16S rRNA (guanine527-N7)-methyltransferase